MEDVISKLPPFVLLTSFAGFWISESLLPARQLVGGWWRTGSNLAMSALTLAIGALTGGILLGLSSFVAAERWGLAAATLPGWVTIMLGVLLLDVTEYARHRMSHALPLLWRLHRVHHSDPEMDVTTTFRSHPLEQVLRPIFLAVSILTFGIPTLALLLFGVLQLPVLIFQHSNLRLPAWLDRGLGWLIATPALHAVHHSRADFQTDSNYGTFLMVWDCLFRSLQPPTPPVAIGLDDMDDEQSQSVRGLLVEPWRRRSTKHRDE
jgi:sterol desaturase/sphingolipid hydroxylase (fatty acid hydroxylase superfamily)